MPNTKSAQKRLRQNEKHYLRNKAKRSEMKTSVKNVELAAEKGDVEKAKKELHKAVKVLNRNVKHDIIHKNKAARLESRLTKLVNSLTEQKSSEETASE